MRKELAEHLPLIESCSDHAVLLHCLDLVGGSTSGRSSFELHTPLELMARYRLLPWVDREFRHAARAQMLATALDFRRVAKPIPQQSDQGAAGALDELERGVGADASWQDIASDLGRPDGLRRDQLRIVAHLLGDRVIANVGAAGHGHLLLAHAFDSDGWIREALSPHIRFFVDWFASDEQTEGAALLEDLRPLATAEDAEEVSAFLASIPRNSAKSEHGGVRGVLDRARKTGFDCGVRSDSDARPQERCAAAMEVAARFMLLETDEMEYGWSHCLTLPEAACTLAEHAPNARSAERAVVVAISYVAAFVSALRSGTPLPPLEDAARTATQSDLLAAFKGKDALQAAPAVALAMKEDEAMRSWHSICSLASIRPDAHFVKYAYACLRCADGRTQHPRVFLAAAAKLLAAWMQRFPDGMELADLLTDRLA